MTISRHVQFGTAEVLLNQHAKTLVACVKKVKALYAQRGFKIQTFMMDGEFECLPADLADMQINLNDVVSNDEHVPEIERRQRTVKERVRCVWNTLDYNTLPPRMIVELVYASNFWLNAFPTNGGISATLSPRAIIVAQTSTTASTASLNLANIAKRTRNTTIQWPPVPLELLPVVLPETNKADISFTACRLGGS
jgi:hypothetical protein